ncbi:EG45-like domain containing protein [Syzygium oleosum]|uniref:EG45-like domain containing protein n=1 Tax=Syzygium oleosum TaxID=219896 RepID=UPI0011D23566|nr:EG45-like domain containing protein [Syzygium oleosum]
MLISRSLAAHLHTCFLLLILLAFGLPEIVPVVLGDVGTASHYTPPYQPTECYGGDPSQFPSSNLFAAAGDGVWDNGAACGRQYLVRCISASKSGTCIPERTIQIKIVDYALSSTSAAATSKQSVAGATLVLSQTAFGAIANSSVTSINVEFQQV